MVVRDHYQFFDSNKVDEVIGSLTSFILNQWQLGSCQWWRRVARVVKGMNNYAAMTLGKNLISTGRAWRQTMPIVDACYGVCVIELLALAGWRGERKSGGL
jgi:hypothetical protein